MKKQDFSVLEVHHRFIRLIDPATGGTAGYQRSHFGSPSVGDFGNQNVPVSMRI
jgi:hypothetical protein